MAERHASQATAGAPTFVSLNPCSDAVLVEVAQPEQILALSHYSSDPASSSLEPGIAARYAFTGGTAEEVLALEPDIVLASTFIAPATKAAFERLGVRVETFGNPGSSLESFAQIERLAALSGERARAAALIDRIEQSQARLTRGRKEHGDVETLLWQSGQIVAGEGALVTQVLAQAGFTRGGEARGSARRFAQGDYVSLERLLADPPELILVAGKSAGQGHPALAALDDTRIAALDPSLFYCGGPSLIALGERLQELRTSIETGAK